MAAKDKPVQPKNIPEGLAKNDVPSKPLNLPNLIDATPIRSNKKARPGPRPQGEFDLRDFIRKVTDFGILLTCLAILTWNISSPLYKKLMEPGRQHDYPFELPEMKGWHQGVILATLLGSLVISLAWWKYGVQWSGCPCALKHAGLAGVAAASSFMLGKDVTSKKVNRQEEKKAEDKVLSISNALKYTLGTLVSAALVMSAVSDKVKKKDRARTGDSTNISMPGVQTPEATAGLLTNLAKGAGKAARLAGHDSSGKVIGGVKNLLILGLMALHGAKFFNMPNVTSGEKHGTPALSYVALWAATVPFIFYAVKRAGRTRSDEGHSRMRMFSRKSLKAAGMIALVSAYALTYYTLQTKPDSVGMSTLQKAAVAAMTPAAFYAGTRTQMDQATEQVDIEPHEGMFSMKNLKTAAIVTLSLGQALAYFAQGPGMGQNQDRGMSAWQKVVIAILTPAVFYVGRRGWGVADNSDNPQGLPDQNFWTVENLKSFSILTMVVTQSVGMLGHAIEYVNGAEEEGGEQQRTMSAWKIAKAVGAYGSIRLAEYAILGHQWTRPGTETAKKRFYESGSFRAWVVGIFAVQTVMALKSLWCRFTDSREEHQTNTPVRRRISSEAVVAAVGYLVIRAIEEGYRAINF